MTMPRLTQVQMLTLQNYLNTNYARLSKMNSVQLAGEFKAKLKLALSSHAVRDQLAIFNQMNASTGRTFEKKKVEKSNHSRLPGLKYYGPHNLTRTKGDAGYDIRYFDDTGFITMSPKSTYILETSLHVIIPSGYVGILKDRSSLAGKGLVTSGGVIDESYRGPIKVIMENTNNYDHQFSNGDKICQMIVVRVPHFVATQITKEEFEKNTTDRGDKGFGSTGV
jgi:dUTP pyrophosphatase